MPTATKLLSWPHGESIAEVDVPSQPIRHWLPRFCPRALSILGFGVVLVGSATSRAAPPEVPEGTAGQDSATSGATELEGQGTFGTAKDPAAAEDEESTDATELSVSTGVIVSTGNAESAAVTGASTFRLRRGMHQFGAVGAGNWSATPDEDGDWRDTVGNVQGRVRYDVFFARRWSAFLMVTARHDPFQGFELRLNVDPGIAFYALPEPENRLWFEAGYDFQFDLRRDEAIVAQDVNSQPIRDVNGEMIRIADKQAFNHAARLFAGYSNRMHEAVTFDVGFEWLQSVLEAGRYRFIGDVALTTQLAGQFSLATTFTMRYENQPLPEVKKLDTITALSLVYTIK